MEEELPDGLEDACSQDELGGEEEDGEGKFYLLPALYRNTNLKKATIHLQYVFILYLPSFKNKI